MIVPGSVAVNVTLNECLNELVQIGIDDLHLGAAGELGKRRIARIANDVDGLAVFLAPGLVSLDKAAAAFEKRHGAAMPFQLRNHVIDVVEGNRLAGQSCAQYKAYPSVTGPR